MKVVSTKREMELIEVAMRSHRKQLEHAVREIAALPNIGAFQFAQLGDLKAEFDLSEALEKRIRVALQDAFGTTPSERTPDLDPAN